MAQHWEITDFIVSKDKDYIMSTSNLQLANNLSWTRFLLLTVSVLALSACSNWPPSGSPTSYVEGSRYMHGCICTYDVQSGFGSTSGETRTTVSTCSNGTPSDTLKTFACASKNSEVRREQMELFEGGELVNDVDCTPESSTAQDRYCAVQDGLAPGDGMIISGLSRSVGGMNLLNDSTGSILGDSYHSRLTGTTSGSPIQVHAKFAGWRTGATKASGKIQLDPGPCTRGGNCTIALRYLELDVDDFIIVRPTVFARDVTLRDISIYTLNNYNAAIDSEGRFSFDGIKLMVAATVNGRRGTLLHDVDFRVSGRMAGFRGTGLAAPEVIKIKISERTGSVGLDADLSFDVKRFEVKLYHPSTGKCVRGNSSGVRVSQASVESCRTHTAPHKWIMQQRGSLYQITQPHANTCLNVKTSTENRDGGRVEVVGCSSHSDQLWRLQSGNKLIHSTTGKCLNLRSSRENRNGGKLSITGCSNHTDQKWRLSPAI